MAISNELSSEIAAAILSEKKKSPQELSQLKDIILKVHSALQQMSEEARQSRLESRQSIAPDRLKRAGR